MCLTGNNRMTQARKEEWVVNARHQASVERLGQRVAACGDPHRDEVGVRDGEERRALDEQRASQTPTQDPNARPQRNAYGRAAIWRAEATPSLRIN